MLILAVIDLLHRRKRVLQTISQGQGLVAMLAIALTVIAINFIGDGLRDCLDPRTWRTRAEKEEPGVIGEPV